MKELLVGILAVAMAFSLLACESEQPTDENLSTSHAQEDAAAEDDTTSEDTSSDEPQGQAVPTTPEKELGRITPSYSDAGEDIVITSLIYADEKNVEAYEVAEFKWDLSLEEGTEEVISYLEGDTIHIQADGKIVAPDDMTGYVNGSTTTSAFGRFKELVTLDVSGLDTSNVTNMKAMFIDLESLETLILGDFNTSNVTDMRMMFRDLSKLTTLNVSSLDTSNVTNMWQMFQGMDSITSLDLSNFDTKLVTTMDDMFYSCGSLETLNLSSFETPVLEELKAMFAHSEMLKSIDMSGVEFADEVRRDDAFMGLENTEILVKNQAMVDILKKEYDGSTEGEAITEVTNVNFIVKQ